MKTNEKPRLIVIGLTGPVGSGCSTLADIFIHNGNKIFNQTPIIQHMLEKKYFTEATLKQERINYSVFDETIKKLYKKRFEICNEIKKLYEEKNTLCEENIDLNMKIENNTINDLEEKHNINQYLHKELKIILEKRETLRSLEYLFQYKDNNDQHHFRKISVSNLILFRVLMEIEKGGHVQCSYGDNEIEYLNSTIESDINRIINDIYQFNNNIIGTIFKNPKNKLCQLHDFINQKKYLQKKNKEKSKSIINILYFIEDEIKKLKINNLTKSIYYRELMQDFGDNIRQCGNPLLFDD
ncbi:MAG: hypothetical protein ABIH39_02605 [Candidatus Margulisiibacteriota bacterium]